MSDLSLATSPSTSGCAAKPPENQLEAKLLAPPQVADARQLSRQAGAADLAQVRRAIFGIMITATNSVPGNKRRRCHAPEALPGWRRRRGYTPVDARVGTFEGRAQGVRGFLQPDAATWREWIGLIDGVVLHSVAIDQRLQVQSIRSVPQTRRHPRCSAPAKGRKVDETHLTVIACVAVAAAFHRRLFPCPRAAALWLAPPLCHLWRRSRRALQANAGTRTSRTGEPDARPLCALDYVARPGPPVPDMMRRLARRPKPVSGPKLGWDANSLFRTLRIHVSAAEYCAPLGQTVAAGKLLEAPGQDQTGLYDAPLRC